MLRRSFIGSMVAAVAGRLVKKKQQESIAIPFDGRNNSLLVQGTGGVISVSYWTRCLTPNEMRYLMQAGRKKSGE